MNIIQNKIGGPARRTQHRILVSAALLLLPLNVWAIPSPDLVINLSASVAQLLGLLSVVFGSFALSGNKGIKKKNRRARKGGQAILGIIAVLLLASLTSNILQYTSTVDAKNERLQTNLVRKSVENGNNVGDVNLKTLSFSDQKVHPQGISTETLAEWLDADKPLHIIDVREDEEFETGSIEGAAHVRYPDVLANSNLLADTGNTLFLCYSGNRSSELCSEFTKQGKSCNFMVGGYEKWLAESRPLGDNITISTEELRQIPDFKNKNVLLDTPEVRVMVQEQAAEFIDLRYPGDFVKNHLPGAHNITMRALRTETLDERIKALPDVPLIAACYDKRSCFFSQLIGLRLERAGKQFMGRYTVPHEYYEAIGGSERAHVSAWKQQQQVTLGSYVITPLSAILNKLVDVSGHYAIGLLALVILIRLLLLPLALKAERDTVVQKSLKGRIEELKAELGDHPRALSEATMALYKKFRIRPVINMLASLFQLGFMLLFYSAVNSSAGGWAHNFMWLESASAADPLYILPILASLLFVGVFAVQSPPKTKLKAALYMLAGAALFVLLFTLSAAANLYLVISMAFLIAQSALFKLIASYRGWATAGHDKTGTIEDTGLIPLSQAHLLPESTGKKAARLGELMEAGFNVPDGFVFTSVITNRTRAAKREGSLLDDKQRRLLNRLWGRLKTDKVAVRSSGANEDGADNSFAGVYESILNIRKEELVSAVRDVYSSLASDRSDAYTQHAAGEGAARDEGGVVVQKMVPAEYAGVMFTEHPSNTGASMIEMVSGLGEDLVSGNVTPDSYAFGKLSAEFMPADSSTSREPPVDVRPLIALGQQIEELFGAPQDIEWAFAKGQFYLLQARDITRSAAAGQSLKNLAEAERSKLLSHAVMPPMAKFARKRDKYAELAKEPVFIQNELSELLPRPTPLSADFMERLWATGGSTDLACEELGIPYEVNFRSPPYINTVFGWTYINKQEERRRLSKGPGAMASFQLARNAENTENAFREEFLPQYHREMTERDAIDFESLSLDSAVDILGRWLERFVEETYMQAELINISADYHMKNGLAKLKSAGLEPTLYLNNTEETVVTRAMALLSSPAVSIENIKEFLDTFGHRAPLDYELSAPRFNEDPTLLQQYINRSSGEHKAPERDIVPLPDKKVLAVSVRRAQKFQVLKEEAKHYCLIELAHIRSLLLAIDNLCALQGRVFQLKLDEVLQLNDENRRDELVRLAADRSEAADRWKHIQLPSQLSVADLESIDMLTGKRTNNEVDTELAGNRVAGEEEVTGEVRVITDVSQIDSFKSDEILVARMTDPTWYPLFSQARGIITEVGGWLSHAAIVAREYDLPAIVGVSGICQELQTGDIVTLKLDGSITRVENRRDENSPMREREPAGRKQADLPDQAAVAQMIHEVYELNAARKIKLLRQSERRILKGQLSDRRKSVRMSASGEPVRDRRIANRAANMSVFRKAG